MATIFASTYECPVGPLILVSNGARLTRVCIRPFPKVHDDVVWDDDAEPFAETRRQLTEYFDGDRTQFDIPIEPEGTPFQLAIWKQLTRIPYGETVSYSEIGRRLGDLKMSRAVGLANGKNPLPIIIPCHRVIGADGSLTGYSGGLGLKRFLLNLESPALVLPGLAA